MAKFNRVLSRLVPPGPVKDILRSVYYRSYYNLRHAKDNGFRMYYERGHYKFSFDNGVVFKCHTDISDELKRTLPGYLARYGLKKGDTVIDCGAYTGEFALYAAKAVGDDGMVIAFEPDPYACKKIAENLSLNRSKNMLLVEKGVWSREDKIRFAGGTQGANLFSERLADNKALQDVDVTTLDGELRKHGVTKVDFIKMDIEGAEIEALKGAGEILGKNNVHLAIASYHGVGGQQTYHELERMLKGYGYDVETGYPSHLTTYGWRRDQLIKEKR
ncbi:MAG: FkbM family methyltransferase [Candidatus Omnitrophota bacterium]